jgi:hypothetical protein
MNHFGGFLGRPPLRPFSRAAALLASEVTCPPRRPNATAAGFLRGIGGLQFAQSCGHLLAHVGKVRHQFSVGGCGQATVVGGALGELFHGVAVRLLRGLAGGGHHHLIEGAGVSCELGADSLPIVAKVGGGSGITGRLLGVELLILAGAGRFVWAEHTHIKPNRLGFVNPLKMGQKQGVAA